MHGAHVAIIFFFTTLLPATFKSPKNFSSYFTELRLFSFEKISNSLHTVEPTKKKKKLKIYALNCKFLIFPTKLLTQSDVHSYVFLQKLVFCLTLKTTEIFVFKNLFLYSFVSHSSAISL
jgi:hypothetical protein